MPQDFQTRDKGAIVCSFFLPRARVYHGLGISERLTLREQRRVQRFLDDLAELRNCATPQLISRF